ncbi:hypothetical protein SPI_00331 [Niveomyces insectorum RCEF 264]|uniref:Uncharacterized protein n=1 Tax=Niveomyces insectorum RCEF 264 TaxID=1081102 RepID=A0A168A1P8_9HYPO|nr:hypothetical protein SPI_00331 [Niveomyces insectorum RCEF 264]
MSLLEKRSAPSSEFGADSQDLHLQAKFRSLRLIDAARAGATLLALLMGVVVLGVAGNSIQVYNATHAGEAAWLSLWPDRGAFDFRPTVALVAGAAIVVAANLVALSSHHRLIRARLSAAHTPLTFTAPFVGLVAAIVAIALYYSINRSTTADTLLSWSCRWRHLSMTQRPQFGTLCRTSRAGIDLAILLIPVEAAALLLAGLQLKTERYTAAYAHARKTPSPVLA